MSSLLSAELSATCNALGYFDAKSNKYYADSNTLETVKDLIRYLRRDDETHDIRRQLGKTKVLQTDLLPLLKSYWEENDLFDVLLRLIVNLTTPPLILWNEEIPSEKTARNYFLQVEEHLQNYKEAFADEGIWAVLSTILSKILEIDYAERGDENSLIIERILILIRNVLYVPADAMEKRPDNDASIHDQVLWALHQSGMLDITLYITSSAHEQAYYMHILEILSYMLREQRASELAGAALQRGETEKIRDEAELVAIRHRETSEKQKMIKKYAGARHSRFGGTFVVKSMKSIGDNELIYHKPLNKLDALNFDTDKKKPKTPKNRLPFVTSTSERRSAFTIRLFLKEFCVEFLNGAYNTLMYHVKDNLVRAKAQAHDESYYLWAMRFFMEFNRCYKFEVKLVSETMSVQTFHYVQQQSENHFDLMQTDKKKIRLWSRRLHLALLAYRELFYTLCAMDKSPDGTVRDSAKVIKSNIFYVPEYREFILTLLVTFDELKMSDVYLRDLIETQHIFLKMFQSFCGGKEGSTLVQQIKKGGKRRAKKKAKSDHPTSRQLNLENMWDKASSQLSAVLGQGGEFLTEVVPFDAASDVPIDDQKAEAMIKIQRKLRASEFESAVGLLRAAREVWPENDCFGSDNMAPEEEFLALREIFFADLGENVAKTQVQPNSTPEDEDSCDDEEDEEEDCPRYTESDLSFNDFSSRLPHPRIVRACGIALRNFETNPVNTNLCIVKLLHRIAFDCKMYIMVFQLGIFKTFQKIFALKDLPQHQELVRFATYIMRQFFKTAEKNKMVFMETLFWKSKRDAYEIEYGYDNNASNSKSAAKVWSEEEEDELRRLFMEHQINKVEEDVVDWIVNNLIDNTKSRRGVLKKLKELCLLVDYRGKKGAGKSRAPANWGAGEENQLRELYEEFKDAMDPLGCIMGRLDVSRPKNRVVEKMLVMGLIQDKMEMRKKRARAAKSGSKASRATRSDSVSSGSSEVECDDDDQAQTSLATQQKQLKKKTLALSRPNMVHKQRKRVHVTMEREKLVEGLLQNMEEGRQEALEWLRESLSDAIEDFEDGNNEGIPLVPIMDYAQDAMENNKFRAMLRAFGICEPFDEQEIYWRIPAHLTVDVLKNHCSLIQDALDNTLTISPQQPNSNPNEEESGLTSGENDVSLEERNINDEREGAAANVDPSSATLSLHRRIKKRIRLMEESDEETNDAANNDIVSEDSAVENGGSRTVCDSDDDIAESQSKRPRTASDSDIEKPISKKSKVIESDEEEVSN